VDLERPLGPVRLRSGGRADIAVRLDIAELRGHNIGRAHVLRQDDVHLAAAARGVMSIAPSLTASIVPRSRAGPGWVAGADCASAAPLRTTKPMNMGGVLAWLVRHGRRVVNGPGALDLEISKARQYAALEAAGVAVPRTVLVAGSGQLASAARAHFAAGSFILKPNGGGKGLGVRLFDRRTRCRPISTARNTSRPWMACICCRNTCRASEPVITRAEFVGGRFLYAVEVDTTDGFELCPADACAAPLARPKFRIVAGIDPGLRARLETFLADAGVEVAGLELITDAHGRTLAYDVNTNTNYNPEAERADGRFGTTRSGPGALAAFLGAELKRLHRLAA
jgi:hypothetical protein